MKKSRRIRYVTAGLIAALLLLVLLNLLLGSVKLSFADLKCLFGGKTEETAKRILLDLRLPRVLMALILGGALALSGLLLQTFFENPIAGPFVLGISSGAKLVVALSLTLVLKLGGHMSSVFMILASFAGAMITLLLILLVSRRLPRGASLLVAGIMILESRKFFGTDLVPCPDLGDHHIAAFCRNAVSCKAHAGVLSGRDCGGEPRCKCETFPDRTDPYRKPSGRNGYGVCRSDILCRDRSAFSDPQTAGDRADEDNGSPDIFRRWRVLPFCGSFGQKSAGSHGAFHQCGDFHTRSTGGHRDADPGAAQKGG